MESIVNLKHEPELREALDYSPVHNNTVLINRRTKWGNNPFRIGRDGIRAGAIALEELAALDGCWLACWCEPLPCHGQMLARAAAGILAERADA